MFTKRRRLLTFLIGSLTLVSLLGDGVRVEAGKQPCKTCKEFVVSFEKVCQSRNIFVKMLVAIVSIEKKGVGSEGAGTPVRVVCILSGPFILFKAHFPSCSNSQPPKEMGAGSG